MNKDIYILGGARTPMAEYTGKLKDFSALDLGALASRAAMERTGSRTGRSRSRGLRQRAADKPGRGLRRASRRAACGRAHRRAGADGQPALRFRHSVGDHRGQMILLGEADIVLAGGTESMSQAPHVIRGLQQRPSPRSGAARGLSLDAHCSTRTAAARWPAQLRTARRSTASHARSRICTPSAASSWRMPHGRRAGSPRKSCRWRSRRARASKSSRPTITCVRIRRWRGWRSCRRRSTRTVA